MKLCMYCRNKCQIRVPTDLTYEFVSRLLNKLQINNNIKELFADILLDSGAKFNGNRVVQLKSKIAC